MKTMTCRQMGGPCDMPITGETAQEMMDNGAKHIMSMSDDGHKQAAMMMEQTQKDPAANEKWMADFTMKFNAL